MVASRKAVAAASFLAVCTIAVVGFWHEAEQQVDVSSSELLDIDMGSSGSGLDYGLDIPKPTLSANELRKLNKYEKTRTKLLDVIRNLEQKMAGVSRPTVEIRIATTGDKGLPGPQGAPGSIGPPGLMGPVGKPGELGAPGPQGPAGPTGLAGPPGPGGLSGPRGPPGPNGPAGPRGQSGDRGPAGPQGRPGVTGNRGPPGKPGAPGLIGARGVQGARGKPGAPGPVGLPPPEPGTASGSIVNVMNGDALTGVTVRILQGDTIVQNVAVSRTGDYSARLDPGEYTIQGEANGFLRFRRTITIRPGATTTSRLLMCPSLTSGQLRFVLTWNMAVSDLDLHLNTPSGCHVGWQNKVCSSPTARAELDHDDTNGNGPETITINKIEPGTYKVWVHRYSSGNFFASDATLRVFYPSGAMREFHLGQDGTVEGGNTWNVITIDGATGNVFGPVAEGTRWLTVTGSPATFTSISSSQSGLNVWGASGGNVFRRTGITDANKMGTTWTAVAGATAVVGVAASDLGVWVWDEAGNIFARDGVTAVDRTGVSWLRVPSPEGSLLTVAYDGANAVATTTDGKIWWRAGIVPTAVIGSRWFEVPGRMTSISVYSNALWGVRHGKIYRRLNMDTSPPAGTGWEEVPGMASYISVSNKAVWTVSGDGLVFYREGIAPNDPAGLSWGQLEETTRLKKVSVGNGVVWGLDTSDSPVFRDGVARVA